MGRARLWIAAAAVLVLFDGGAEAARGRQGTSSASSAVRRTRPVARRASSIVNANARLAPREYTRPHARGVTRYREFLGREFSRTFDRVKAGEVWIDAGGGLGVAGLGAARSKNVISYVINAQDFWRAKMRPADAGALAEELGLDTTEMPVVTRPRFRNDGTRTEVRTYEKLEAHQVADLVSRARAIKNRVRRDGRFHYLVGFAEHRLPSIGVRARLVTDLYGAYFYSGDRVRLLDLYYQSLAEGGEAFVRIATEDGLGPRSTVRTAGGDDVPLERFLVARYPEVFRFTRDAGRRVLIMTRKPGAPASLELARTLVHTSSEIANVAGMELPSSEFRER